MAKHHSRPYSLLSARSLFLCLFVAKRTTTSAFVQSSLSSADPSKKMLLFPIQSPLTYPTNNRSGRVRRRRTTAPRQQHAVVQDSSYMVLLADGGFGTSAMVAAASILVPLVTLYVSASAMQKQDDLTVELDQNRQDLRTQQTQVENLSSLAQGLVLTGILFSAPIVGKFVNDGFMMSKGPSATTPTAATTAWTRTTLEPSKSNPKQLQISPRDEMSFLNAQSLTTAPTRSLESLKESISQSSELRGDILPSVPKATELSTNPNSPQNGRTTLQPPRVSDSGSSSSQPFNIGSMGGVSLVIVASALTGAFFVSQAYAREQDNQVRILQEEKEKELEELRRQAQETVSAQPKDETQLGYWVPGLVVSGLLLAAPLIVNLSNSGDITKEKDATTVLVGKASTRPPASSMLPTGVSGPLSPTKKSTSTPVESSSPLGQPIKTLKGLGVTIAVSAVILLGSVLLSPSRVEEPLVEHTKTEDFEENQTESSSDKEESTFFVGQVKEPGDGRANERNLKEEEETVVKVDLNDPVATNYHENPKQPSVARKGSTTSIVSSGNVDWTRISNSDRKGRVSEFDQTETLTVEEELSTSDGNLQRKSSAIVNVDHHRPVTAKSYQGKPEEATQIVNQRQETPKAANNKDTNPAFSNIESSIVSGSQKILKNKEAATQDKTSMNRSVNDRNSWTLASGRTRGSIRSWILDSRERFNVDVARDEIALARSIVSEENQDIAVKASSGSEGADSGGDTRPRLAGESGRVSTSNQYKGDDLLRRLLGLVNDVKERLSRTRSVVVTPESRHLTFQVRLWTSLSLVGAAFPNVQFLLRKVTWLVCVAQMMTAVRRPQETMGGSSATTKYRGGDHVTRALAMGGATWIVGALVAHGRPWSTTASFAMQNFIFWVASCFLTPVKKEVPPNA